MNQLAKVVAGSRLYGTHIDGVSDYDFRGVYLPPREDCLLNRIKDTITDATEEDTQYFSLQYFLQLAAQGQSMAIEMLSCNQAVSTSVAWDLLRMNRHRFYTRNMHSFLGYAKSMSGKYSSRIDRLNEIEAIIDYLWDGGDSWLYGRGNERLSTVWDGLPESLNAVKTVNERNANADKRVYVVCGRELQATVTIAHAHGVVKAIYDSYGERVRKAKDGQLDWKALMHAFRVAYQAREIVETRDLVYPLKQADYLREMRMGHFDFIKEGLDAKLDDLISEVQAKMDASDLPDKVDQAWLDGFILDVYAQEYPAQ